ncbi:hypothetical protein EL22_23760 [Halostagnicola sp. A56]|uniref:hypothetical protein n=1 Tax=Halostagnicola sp. A56 TaxID=1495067 RepID=UPI00049EA505|nr:hypothetical protein [Halostagnicola sp. A56]KDE59272.1 hypothetical protein EL22_23760 [Halostagnicola sp. A56]
MVRRAQAGTDCPGIVPPIAADGSTGREGLTDRGEHTGAVLEAAKNGGPNLEDTSSGMERPDT